MKTSVIQLKLKDTEQVSWSKALSSYLKRNYGPDQWSQLFDANKVKELDNLRVNANSDLAPEALLEQNLKYYAYLEQIYIRIGNQSSKLNLKITWYNAEYEGPSKRYTQKTVVFEKSSVLYNIGALLRQVAQEKTNSDYKEGVVLLSKAVSCFTYMSSTFLNSPSIDLQSDVTKFLAALSHAEAQELFLLKLVNDSQSDSRSSLISKLSLSCSSLFEQSLENYTNKALWDAELHKYYGERNWKSIMEFKHLFYKGIAAYNYALSLEQSGKIGQAVAFMKKGLKFITAAKSHKSNAVEELNIEGTQSMVEEKLKIFSKDNDYVYHELVPEEVELNTIKPMDAIKVTPLEVIINPYMESVSESSNEIFRGIVPVEVYEKESVYSEEKSKLLRMELDTIQDADWQFNSFVEFTDISRLVDDLEKRLLRHSIDEDPQVTMMRQQLQKWSQSVCNSPFKDIAEQNNHLLDKRQQIMKLLTLVPESNKEDVVKVKASLLQASQSDERLFSTIKLYLEEIKLLGSPNLLWKHFNSFNSVCDQPNLLDIDDSKNDQIIGKLKHIKELYENLRILKEERTVCAEDLKEAMRQDDITKTLILNYNKPEALMKAIFKEELEKFKPFRTRIEATVYKQSNTINEIKLALDDVFKLTNVQDRSEEEREKQIERIKFFEKIEKAFLAFNIFSTDLPKGLSFYDRLHEISKTILQTNPAKDQLQDNTPSGDLRAHQLSSVVKGMETLSLNEGPKTNSHQPISATGPYNNQGNPLPPKIPTRPSPTVYHSMVARPPLPDKAPRAVRFSSKQPDPADSQNPTAFYNTPSVFNEDMYS